MSYLAVGTIKTNNNYYIIVFAVCNIIVNFELYLLYFLDAQLCTVMLLLFFLSLLIIY